MSILKKVRATILDHQLFSKGETVVVGVSGGPDSFALLHLLIELAPDLDIKLHVAHLNHQLRGEESDADAAFVSDAAAKLGVPATIGTSAVAVYARAHHLSTEEGARVMRYRFLFDVAASSGAATVAVGHNADDQVETVMMHMLRGAGLAGLRGMTYKSRIPFSGPHIAAEEQTLWLVRPLLDLERTEIETYCRENSLNPRFDASNLDTTLFRNRLRREVIPYLEQLNPNLREVIRRSARTLADDYEYLSGATESAFAQVVVPEGGSTPPANLARFVLDREKWRSLHPSLQRATLREAVRRLRHGLRNISWAHIEDARRVAFDKEVGAEATLPQGLALVVGYDEIIIGETVSLPDVPLLHVEVVELKEGTTIELPETRWQVRVEEKTEITGAEVHRGLRRDEGNGWGAELDAGQIRGGLKLRSRRAGERFEPLGFGGHHKSLHEFMIEEKIPRHIRDLLPILADDEKILWVCGYRVDERAKVTERTRRSLKLEFFKSVIGG